MTRYSYGYILIIGDLFWINRIVKGRRKLKVKDKIILNQADLGDKAKIQKIAKKYKIKIEKEIPYSKKIVGAYSKGKLLNFKL